MPLDLSSISDVQLHHFIVAIATIAFLAGLVGAFVLHIALTAGEWVAARFMAWEQRAERIATARARAAALSKAMPRG